MNLSRHLDNQLYSTTAKESRDFPLNIEFFLNLYANSKFVYNKINWTPRHYILLPII
jgi:hypothetical protein